jgi:murein DD-endopeptidase MepM/ murein hydrolase activator NlpD
MKTLAPRPLLKWLLIPLILIMLTSLVFIFYQLRTGSSFRTRQVISWIRNPNSHPEWMMNAKTRCTESTPFLFPTDGFIGYLWNDSFRPGHHHQGVDIFTDSKSGETPVYAVYDGYLTRLSDWKSSLILRIPEDPLDPHRQIWIYYTHLADAQGNSYILDNFPPGSSEVFVKEGTLLGYQGNYSGNPGNPTGIHLHLSIVMDDEQGSFLNELKIQNTLDPSLYFDLPLNGKINTSEISVCSQS